MSVLAHHAEEYVALRRSLGFKLEREERLLGQFATYLAAAGAENVRSELAIAWAKLPSAASPNQWAKRLGVVRRFAVYLKTIDETTEVPPSGVFPRPGTDRLPTCSPRPTSPACSKPPEDFARHFAPRRTRPSSACSRRAACGSARQLASRVGTSISPGG